MKISEIAKKSTMRAKTADEAVYAFAAIRELEKENFKQAHKLSVDLHNKLGTLPRCNDLIELNRNLLLFNAPYNFDSFCQYIELDRDPKSRFYMPRRKQLIRMVNTLQKLEDGELDIAGIMMPPGTGKSTTAIFYLTWLAGRNPDMPILGGSHSNAFLRGVYDECLRIMAKGGEYLWRDVFPGVCIARTNAQDMMIDMYKPKRFATLEFSSIGSGNAGKVRAQKLLYCDDLVSGIEEAMSPERMDKLWQLYTTDLRQRKIGEYKAQIQAEQDLAAANDRLAASKEAVDTATTALSNYRDGLSTWGEMLADLGLDAQYNALSDSLSKANEAYETATSDVQAQQEALTNANSAIDTYTQKLVDIKSGNFDMADSVISSTNQVDTSMAQVRDSANQTAGTVTSANSNITTSATNSAATISSSYSAAAQSVQGSTGQMSSAAENAKERMTQSANNTASTYAASFDNINSGARRNAETVKDSASNAASGVEDAATRSGNALSGLPEKAKQWGSDFASSFVDSFVDTWTVLKSGFEDAAKWISERFHFSVPDKGPLADADTWMPDMMKLFASGIERNKNSVIRQVAGLSASMQKELTDAPVNVSAEGTVISKHDVEVSGKQFSSAQAYRTGNGSADVVAAIRALGTIMERNSDTKVVINGREVFRAVKDEAHREQIRTGSPAF